MHENILAIIPARGCMDEVAHMNIREIGGYPMIHYTINSALKSSNINRIVVSTEDSAVEEIAIKSGVEVPFKRPEYLCDGNTTLADVVSFTLEKLYDTEKYECDIVVVLLPNTPFKTVADIDNMINHLKLNNFDSVIPLCRQEEFLWKIENGTVLPVNFDNRKKRIDSEPLYEEKGGIYVYNKRVFANLDKLSLGEKRSFYLIGTHNAQTIHTIYDFFILERLIKLPDTLIKILMEHE